MVEAIYCRIKILFMLSLFALPIGICMWSRYLDAKVEEARYLPALEPFLWANASDEPESQSPELADLSDLADQEIP